MCKTFGEAGIVADGTTKINGSVVELSGVLVRGWGAGIVCPGEDEKSRDEM